MNNSISESVVKYTKIIFRKNEKKLLLKNNNFLKKLRTYSDDI